MSVTPHKLAVAGGVFLACGGAPQCPPSRAGGWHLPGPLDTLGDMAGQ